MTAGRNQPSDGDPPDPPASEGDSSEGDGGAEVEDAVVEEFEKELAAARRKADENWDNYLRAQAELENFRKVSQRRVAEAAERQARGLLESFLDVSDNLGRALSHGGAEPDAVITGVEGTYRALTRLLEREGVTPIDATDQPFDPALHEAVGVVEVPGLTEQRVVAVERPGYLYKGELLRPARVVVGKPPEGS